MGGGRDLMRGVKENIYYNIKTPSSCGELLKAFEIPFQREAAPSQLEGEGKGTEKEERDVSPHSQLWVHLLLCSGTWRDRCSLESTRKHLDSLASSDAPPARAGGTQNRSERNLVEEVTHTSPTSKNPMPCNKNRGSRIWVSLKGRNSSC